jgi:hypothetical protein
LHTLKAPFAYGIVIELSAAPAPAKTSVVAVVNAAKPQSRLPVTFIVRPPVD